MWRYFLIFAASGAGGVLRFWLGGKLQHWAGEGFPWGTLGVNVSGCLGIGFVATAIASAFPVRQEVGLALIAGLFGGYTTFSAFGRETVALWNDGHAARAVAYVAATNLFGILAVCLGAWLAGFLPDKSPGP